MTHSLTDPYSASSSAVVSAGREVRDLHVILGVARAMAGITDHDALLAMILDSVRQILNAERATLFLYDEAADELYSKIAHDSAEIRIAANTGIAGAAAQTRKLINIPDAYDDPRFNRDVDARTGYRTRCLLAVPLTGSEGRLVGVVQVLNKCEGVFNAYDERLAEALAAQVGVALQRARLMEHFVQKKQLEASLAQAREIQQGLLPKKLPQVPGYDLAGWSCPAEQTGGDCYDLMSRPDGRLGVVLADATGHGIAAALMISETRALLRAISGYAPQPADVLTQANRWLCANELDGKFVTAFYGVFDPAGHRLEYASAGHGPLFWYQAGRHEVAVTGATGWPLGMMDPTAIEPAPPVALGPGDMAVLLTDGFIEAQNPAGVQFGKGRTIRVILDHADRPAAEVIRGLEAAVWTHMAGGPQLDDLTAVVLRRCG